MPPRAFASDPRPAPAFAAPEPSPESPLPGPFPRPMPFPPPLPPRPLFAVPSGDMAIAPPPEPFGTPTFEPGWLETTTPVPAVLPLFPGGAADEPKSNGLPVPEPLLPRPFPLGDFPPPIVPPSVGGGGMTALASSWPALPRPPLACPFEDPPEDPFPPMLAGGGTTSLASVPLPARPRPCALTPPAEGGGGTGCERKSPVRALPQLLISCAAEGGGATTFCAGNDSLAMDEESRVGAETGGATTSLVCESCAREAARSRGVVGAGATTVDEIAVEARSLPAATFGAGAMTCAFMAALRRVSCATSGAGATTLLASEA